MANLDTTFLYDNYIQYKSALNIKGAKSAAQGQITKQLNKTFSLAEALQGKTKGAALDFTQFPSNFATFQNELRGELMNKFIILGKSITLARKNGGTLNSVRSELDDLIKALNLIFQIKQTSGGYQKLQGFRLKLLGAKDLEGLRTIVNQGWRTVPTAIGEIGEDLLKDLFNDPNFQEAEAYRGMREAIGNFKVGKNPGAAGIRVNNIMLTEEGKFKRFSKSRGTPLVDISLDSDDIQGKVRISVKTSASSKATLSHLRGYTGPLGSYFTNIPTGNSLWFAIHRDIGRNMNADTRKYLIYRNIKEILIGTGADSVGDYILNGKLYSAREVMSSVLEKDQISLANITRARVDYLRKLDQDTLMKSPGYIEWTDINNQHIQKVIANVTLNNAL